jgi:hypothetical protein
VHYFDRNARRGLPWYLRNMPALPAPPKGSEKETPEEWDDWRRYVSTHIVGEASPSYVLGVGIASSIKRVLPHSKVIVMLRDPVQRTYSEIMMKKRRVVNQPETQQGREYKASRGCCSRLLRSWNKTACGNFNASIKCDYW